MARNKPQIIFLYLLLPAIFIIFIYSFIFAKFSTVNQPYNKYQNYFYRSDGNDTSMIKSTLMESLQSSNDDDEVYKKPEKNSSMFTIKLSEKFHQLLQSSNTDLWSESLEDRFRMERPKFPLKVIIVPHSHNDPGWLNTYDQYFYHYTYYVLENLVKNLNKYPNMTFVWAEMSFFSRWWDSLTTHKMKENLKKLLDENRFEIVTGGWVMSDEGSTHYFDMIDQLIEGHQFLRTTLKSRFIPRNSWSIDPFGHSATYSYLLKKSGISNIYIQRTHYAWKKYLSEKRYLEFFWKQSFELDESDSMPLCHMSPLHLYSFKYACGPDYKVCLEFDFRKIYGETSESTAIALNQTNIESKADKIIKQYSKLASLFSHNVALVLLGDDFRYNFDIEWQQQYRNYMLLMDYINSNGAKFNYSQIMFGTLEDYFNVINERIPIEKKNYPIFEGDFIPYADVYVDSNPSYWTGYFTTRPYFKFLSRELQHWLRSTEIIYSFVRSYVRQHIKSSHLNVLLDREYNVLTNARQNLALFQHHDGITGTSKDYVMEDYGRRLSHSLNTTIQVFAKMIQYLNLDSDTLTNNNTRQFIFVNQFKSNWHSITERSILKIPANQDGLRLLVFNPHTQFRTESIKVLADDPFIQILDMETNKKIQYQINPIFNGSKVSSTIFEIEFFDLLDPLSLKNYKIMTNEENLDSKVTIFKLGKELNRGDNFNEAFQFVNTKCFSLENDFLVVTLNTKGFIEKIYFKNNNITELFEMSFISYDSEPQKSGAYLLKFIRQDPYPPLFFSRTPIINLFKGKLSSSIIVNYTDIVYSIKLYNSKSNIGAFIELKILVDLENKSKYENQEIAFRIKTRIDNRKRAINETYRTFYVDSNGFQLFERRFMDAIGVEGNYYPMTSSFFIEDSNARLTVLSSHSHGATSPQDGMIEIMLDRRIVYDDKRGLSEGILDNIPVQSSFWLVFEQQLQQTSSRQSFPPALTELADSLLLQLNYPSNVMYSYQGDQDVTKDQSKTYYLNRYLISPSLLCKYFLLNLRTLPNYDSFTHPSRSSLMILHHRASYPSIYGPMDVTCDDDISNFSRPLTHLFNNIQVASIRQTSLTGLKTFCTINSSSQLNVPPFHIEAYNVTFY